MSRSPLQRVVVLDLQQALDEDAIAAILPHERWGIEFLRLSDHLSAEVVDAARVGHNIDFVSAAIGVDALVRAIRGAPTSEREVEWYVCGRAPLPLFAQLGHQLSAWGAPIVFLNQRKGGVWDRLPLSVPAAEPEDRFFKIVTGVDGPSEASGRVAVFVSTLGQPANTSALREFIEGQGQSVAGIVELRTEESAIVDASNFPAVAGELAGHMSNVAAGYPHALAHGMTVFVAGPAQLAYVAGRAVNRNMVGALSIPNFAGGPYVEAVDLPVAAVPSRALDMSDGAVEARADTKKLIRAAFEEVRDGLKPEHVPDSLLDAPQAEELIAALRQIEWSEECPADGFALRILERELAIGDALIDALSVLGASDLARTTQQLVVHELFHDFQSLTHANYRQVGRAGVVLEEIDFWADVFAVLALAAYREDEGENRVDAVKAEIEAVLAGVKAFDRSEQGDRLDQLYERRLRRYLIWNLQRARAATLHESQDVDQMFESRLIVELVPTSGILDARGDKVVRQPRAGAQLVVLCNGRLERFPTDDNINPAALVDHVRSFNQSELNEAMQRAVGMRGKLLAPWATVGG